MVAIFEPHLLRGSKTELDQTQEDSPYPSATSYWCYAEGFYLTIFEHWTPVGKPL